MIRVCRICGDELNNENWYPSHRKNQQYMCNRCSTEKMGQWCKWEDYKLDITRVITCCNSIRSELPDWVHAVFRMDGISIEHERN